jgi:hypothetical protein
MKLNPYAIILIVAFLVIVNITNSNIKKDEKTINDSSAYFDDSTIFIREM